MQVCRVSVGKILQGQKLWVRYKFVRLNIFYPVFLKELPQLLGILLVTDVSVKHPKKEALYPAGISEYVSSDTNTLCYFFSTWKPP